MILSAITKAKILSIAASLPHEESLEFLAAVFAAKWSCDHSLLASLLA